MCTPPLNDKGLHDFEKRMIISKLLGGGGLQPPGCYGPESIGSPENYVYSLKK
jgi:hypothetical protein